MPRIRQRSTKETISARRMTLFEAAHEFAVSRTTLRRRIQAAQLPLGDGELYTIAQIHQALVGAKEAEQIRKLAAEADILELERAEKRGDLVPMAEAEAMVRDAHMPVRQRLLALPAEEAARCNPTDPHVARESLDRWVNDMLPVIRFGIAKATKEP